MSIRLMVSQWIITMFTVHVQALYKLTNLVNKLALGNVGNKSVVKERQLVASSIFQR